MSRNSIKKRCDRGTLDYNVTDGLRMIPQYELDRIQREQVAGNGVVYTDTPALEFGEPQIRAKAPAQDAWGYGRAELVEPLGGSSEIVVSLSDVHYPFQDTKVVDSALELIAQVD